MTILLRLTKWLRQEDNMSYCDGNCEYLERDKRHTCAKYGKQLAWSRQSGNGSIGFTVHEEC